MVTNHYIDLPEEAPVTAVITGPVKIEDTAGNPITTTAGALNVTGNTVVSGTVDTNLNGLSTFQTSQYTVGTSAVQLTPTPLTNRSSMSIKVTTTSNSIVVYVGNSNAVTSSTGFALFDGDTIQLDLTTTQQVWVISTLAGQTVYVAELG